MRKYTKKVTCIICSLILSISLFTGCNSTSTKNSSNNSSINSEIKADKGSKDVFENLNEDTNGDNVMDTIKELTSPKYNGRLTGSKGNKLATKYLETQFENLELKALDGIDGYLQYYNQKVPFMNSVPKMNIKDSNGNVLNELIYRKDFFAMADPNSKLKGEANGQMLYIDSKEKCDSNKENIKNKVVILPTYIDNFKEIMDKLGPYLYETSGIILVVSEDGKEDQDFKKPVNIYNNVEYRQLDQMPILAYCDIAASKVLIEEAKKGNSIELSVDFSVEEKKVANVVGYIPGTNPELKDNYIIISGHFDHLGSNHDGTYNPGASDNASGVGVIIELARIIKYNNLKPEKPIIFVAFNGEENGLYGSKYFAENSGIDISKTLMLNVDMIANKIDVPLTICSVNDSKLLQDVCTIAEDMKFPYKKLLDAPFSDHVSIEDKGGQAVTFVEIEQTEYHTPKDTIDIINKVDLEQTIELLFRYLSVTAF